MWHCSAALFLRRAAVLLAFGLVVVPGQARSVDDPATANARPRIGLALSGGGARGFSHVGVLRALEALRVPVDCIAGTSAGSAVGAAYALGLSPDEIEAHLKATDWDGDIFNDQPSRPELPFRAKERLGGAPIAITLGLGEEGLRGTAGVFAGQKIELFLHRMLQYSAELESFDQLALPFRAVATDLATGTMVVQDRGSLVHAVRASMAVPSVFAPVRIGRQLLVDGGLTQNLPVQAVRQACADTVIAINIGSPLLQPEELTNVFSVAMQIVSILMERNVVDSLASLGQGDVLIVPDLQGVSAVDFSRGTQGIPAGEAATLAARASLARLALSPQEYSDWQAQRVARRLVPPRVGGVRVAQTRFVNPDVFSLPGVLGKGEQIGEIDSEALERTIRRWSGSGDFTSIAYSLRPDRSGYTLWVDPQEKSWGPDYVQLGFAGFADSHSNADFAVSAILRKTWQNRSGGEWLSRAHFGRKRELETRWFQPLGVGSPWYVEPRLRVTSQPRKVFANNVVLGEFTTEREELEIGGGVQDSFGEAHFGLVRSLAKTSSHIGFTNIDPFRTNVSGWRLRLTHDSLDDLDFPRSGSAVRIETFHSLQGLGATSSYRRSEADLQTVFSRNDHTVRLRSYLARVDSGGQGTLDLVSTGGFMRLSGYQNGQFLSRGVAFGSLTYYQRLVGLPQPLGSGLFVGGALEYARIRSLLGMRWGSSINRTGMAVFVGASTGFGPVYLGVGFGQQRQRNLYLFIGRP